MGWNFCHKSRSAMIEELCDNPYVVRSLVRDNVLWQVRKTKSDNGEDVLFIALYLLAQSEDRLWWGYKGMGEDTGPYVYDCPQSFFAEVSQYEPLNQWAAEWRDKVRELHKKIYTVTLYV